MSDREYLERAEARVLFTTWQTTKQKVMTPERRKHIARLYGHDAVERITAMMSLMKEGEMQ
jgi:hypothetical protein